MKITKYITIILLTVLSVLALQCGPSGYPPAPPTPPPTHPRHPSPLEMNDVTGKPWYSLGEIVEVKFLWENVTNESVTVKPFPLAVEIRGPYDSVVWSCTGGAGERTLKPGETLSYTLTWDQRDNNGQIIEPGYYFLTAEYEAIRKSGTVQGGYEPLRIFIQFPQGAIDKTIVVEQMKTLSDGSSLCLKNIELSSFGAKAYATMVPVDYVPPASDTERSLWGPAVSHAYYRLDSGALKSAGVAGSGFFEEIELEWDLIDPVPKGTRLLTFIIDGIEYQDNLGKEHKWLGPFEFQITLQ